MSLPRLAGIDLSLTGTGLCVDGICDTVRTRHTGMDRLDHIRSTILDAVDLATMVIVEGYSFGSQGRSIYQIGELGGLIRYSLWKHDMPYMDVPPSTLKLFATGKANAGKDQMVATAARCGCPADDNNAVDAWWLWNMGVYQAGGARSLPVTAYRDRAVAALTWPAPAVTTVRAAS